MKSKKILFNPGERLSVPFSASNVSGYGVNALDLLPIDAMIDNLHQMGVTNTFLAIKAPWDQPEEIAKQTEDLRTSVDLLHREGIRVGLWFWPSIYPDSQSQLTKQVLANGKQIMKCCPLDETYISCLEKYMASLTTTGADVLMIDDGYRYGFEEKNFGCFCPLHLREISRIVGRNVTEEEVRRATLSGGENPIRSAFLRVNGDSLVGFAKRMRAAVDKVNPDMRIAVCACLSSWEMDGTDPETVSHAFAGNTKPLLRTSGAPYWAGHRSFGCRMEDIIEFERMQTALFAKPDMEVMWEGDAFPRPRWHCAASYMECFDLARAVSSATVNNLKYLFEYRTELDNEPGYLKRHMRNVPLYQAISERFDDKTPCGVRVFEVPHKYDKMDITKRFEDHIYDLQLTCFNPSSKILSPVGLPTVWEGDGVGIAVFGENAKYLPESEFGKGLILDAQAAEILTARGLDVGLRGKSPYPDIPLNTSEHYLADGYHIHHCAYGQTVKDLELDSSVIPETLFPLADGSRNVVTSYRYENAAGQRFFVFCSDAYGSVERYHRVYGRSRLLARAAEWTSGKRLPAWTSGSPDLYLICKEGNDSLSVALFNLFEDEAIDTKVMLGDCYNRIEFFSGSGKLDGDRVILNDIPPFGFVGFELFISE